MAKTTVKTSVNLKQGKVKKSIGGTLLKTLIPMIVAGIVLIIVILVTQGRNVIQEIALLDLKSEGRANALELGTSFRMLTAKFGEYCDTLEQMPIEDHSVGHKATTDYIKPTTDYNVIENTGLYIGYSDDSYTFANGTVEPDDWKATERDWYKLGAENQTFVETQPYVDAATGKTCVTFTRAIDFYDGSFGVAATDVFLTDLQKKVNELTPMKTGGSAVLAGDYIVSYFNSDYNGKLVSETDSKYLKAVKAFADSGSEEPTIIRQDTSGKDYYVAAYPIQGTSWTLISSVAVSDVMAESNHFMMIAIIIMILVIVAITVVIIILVNKVITSPVNKLSAGILKISGGDFTVKMPEDKGDEIGLICKEMTSFVNIMNDSMKSIQGMSEELRTSSDESKAAAESMCTEAENQSVSMGQIEETMNDISKAVTELAENATNLAHAVSDLTDNGNQTNDTMLQLVEQSKIGQQDMTAVEKSMKDITVSMSDMNDVVTTVGESAKQITEIVQMIDSIAEQTNLLSLNASIEAARAGEAGRGFAVVADEIGKLALSSQDAAKNISDIIGQVTGLIDDLSTKSKENTESISVSSEAVKRAGVSFNKIYDDLNAAAVTMENMIERMGTVNDIAASVAAISEEQSASSEEINATVTTLAESAKDIAEESHGVELTANSVSDSALSINDELSKFKIH